MNSPSDADTTRERSRPIDWVFTVPFLFVFGLLLLVFDPLQRLAHLFGQRPQEFTVGILQRLLIYAFGLAGMRLSVERAPEVKPGTPYIIISNHQSMFDVPIFGGLLLTNYPKYVSKKSLGRRIPSISYNLRHGGNALIDRDNRAQAQEAIRAMGERAQARGVSAVIYPEGTRSRHGELGAFKPGGTITLLDAAPDLDVVPTTIDGSWKLLRHNLLPVPFGVRVRVRFDVPISRSPDLTPQDILEQVQRQITANLAEWRSERDRAT
jgi:1-acyl-sn-glycerol-3-phosphate acyltransferase